MRLTLHTDYAFRVLMALGRAPAEVKSVDDLAREFGVSKHHLMKVAQNLTAGGFVTPVRGRNGGLRLAMPPGEIGLRAVAEHMEPDFNIAGCFGGDDCVFLPGCGLKGVLGQARSAFLQTLGKHNLASIL
ncbi:BadM/Rrf2 family transcriptional regulator [Hoeflea halophila]|uniref:BadM/Rrf2 family transcriptional regulator n=1 Tax=Hoeflea halophila TaxID=714899 RepID=A0A286IBT0_9HYPH|nr:Rrf2 family transcriptional regulator [Hoeflea halophila]SOE17532.1 BadM/Rrf2 family transcriptional regulator [Hoeflea halophila]